MNQRKIQIIRDIEKKVPKEWHEALIKKQYLAPDLRQEVIEQLEAYPAEIEQSQGETRVKLEKDFRRLKNIFDSGYYDAMENVVDTEVAKKIEDFIDQGLQEAIERGDLSDDDEEIKKINKKLKRNAKRNREHSLRTEQGR
jgi:ArsR family metal-binding transcriptional regulator